jgi:Conserved TM helix
MDTFSRLLDSTTAALGPFVPKLLGAITILLLAWVGSRLARAAALRAGSKARIDERLHSPGLVATLAGVVSALVWLLALPALLGTLDLQGLLTPVNAMLSRLMGFVPNVFGALVVLGIGMLLANIARQIVSGLLPAPKRRPRRSAWRARWGLTGWPASPAMPSTRCCCCPRSLRHCSRSASTP